MYQDIILATMNSRSNIHKKRNLSKLSSLKAQQIGNGVQWQEGAVFPTSPGARRGPAVGLPRAPDGTGRLAVVRPVLPKGRTAVFG